MTGKILLLQLLEILECLPDIFHLWCSWWIGRKALEEEMVLMIRAGVMNTGAMGVRIGEYNTRIYDDCG